MKSMLKLQIFSFISRIVAMFSGILQSLIIVNLLSVKQFGLIGLVTSIAGIAGITQHLGLASSSTKEISNAKNDSEILNVVLASLIIRFFISFPVAFILFFFSPQISSYYNEPGLVFPLKIFAIVTLVQAFQSIFNSVISGTHRFKSLFIYQSVISFVSILIYVPLIFKYSLEGFFYSLLIFNLIQTLTLGIIAFNDIKIDISKITKSELISLGKNLLKISLAIYVVKILFTAWQETPVAVLGKMYPLETLALFTFALNFSSKLMSVSDAVTDVNLPVYSKKAGQRDFFSHFKSNFRILFYFIFFAGISASFWAKEILQASDWLIYFIGKFLSLNLTKNIYEKYNQSVPLFLPLILSIIFYSYINILKSSIFVPLEKLRQLIYSFIILIFASFIFYLSLIKFFDGILIMSWSLAFGSFIAFAYSVWFIKNNFNEYILEKKKVLFVILSVAMGLISLIFSDIGFIEKIVLYIMYFVFMTFFFKINILKLVLKKK